MIKNPVFLLVFLCVFAAPCYAGTIQMPDKYVDGRDLPLTDLAFYTVECDGQAVDTPVTDLVMEFEATPGQTCRATVTTVEGNTSAWSNSVVIANPTPAAPVLLE